MSGIDFAALRREREARQGAPSSAATAASSGSTTDVTSGGRRLDGVEVELSPAAERQAGPVIYVGGACKDASGHHALRPAAVPPSAVEVDCRKSGTEVRVRGNVATLTAGLGSLHDRKPASDAECERVVEFLQRDARAIDASLRRGESVWVHCGFNRGPSGLLAYLLLYTDASWDEACGALKAARPRARGRHNTFRQQLEQLADGPKANVLLADHRSLDIRDGGNDPCDDDRR
ncbi:hypothetical protein EMIHUDRAFT_207497 [Emiliania huxleyi CCMP1516]|uniref:Tyrosine specific protein phosphatases domain-containing protein n=2 Tax=Emiliania huxleyi TaxID=2903 RepID=A0A0D3JA18_EMIH1|nr:hypothetical protein EMIHUDRAFT_242079 [Emiliania huxleyi CCMP1516]XP_005774739.1 hypothetical protein EMIHUDRAFT_207497 [Emiliania huxleyi CCMP1516]EOD20353.1 hypothetical protein EMIHUDRAFT_242079 [Emiliania huxleyi CCMP1516]EOD22310.1 hypothetical protein EMIHUDRAFT_207497 [Emiliania huxleyi CCMP1516]|eukprot:XP_005772782.1 hypothetical protein EMIHUDRAFT_242079 [Emiliania huxleyi CCMP1516]